MPGALNYSYTKDVTFYSLDTTQMEEMKQRKSGEKRYKMPRSEAGMNLNLKNEKKVSFDLARNYTGVTYIPNVNKLNFHYLLYSKLR